MGFEEPIQGSTAILPGAEDLNFNVRNLTERTIVNKDKST